MVSRRLFGAFSTFCAVAVASASEVVEISSRAADPCAKIGGQRWVAPSDVRACFKSFAEDEAAKANILEVANKTLAFHTSVNYQVKAPEPFTADVHEDLLADLARIGATKYSSDYDLHIEISRAFKRLNDGHCVWINSCYDSLFVNYLPIPLVVLTESDGTQNVHIAPEAFAVASVEFADQIDVWQDALPGSLKGQLESLNGAKVLLLNGADPWDAVNANAAISGSYQGFGSRQNGFFASYQRSTSTWNYIMGQFAQQSLPLADAVELLVQQVNETDPVTITLPYRSRFGSASVNFTDSASYRANNCVALPTTNGVDVYANLTTETTEASKFKQQPPITETKPEAKRPVNVMMDSLIVTDVVLPPTLTPGSPLPGGFGVGQFYMLNDSVTGVLALGSFSSDDYDGMMSGLLDGLVNLKSQGATQLIVDISNNGGGFICVAHYLHRIIAGPKDSTVPQAGLDTEARDGLLAQMIVQNIIDQDLDPDLQLLYNPLQWRSANNTFFGADENWLVPPVEKTINGRPDAFSQRLGQECQPEGFTVDPPDTALFDTSKVVIVGNGRCASSCSLFSITMAKEEGTKTVVYGGKTDVQQQYCGTVGGQSTDFSTIDTEVKTAHLKNNSLAPPDLIVNGVMGLTWRLGFGIENTQEPEEWQDHPADLNLPLTAAMVNNPVAIWEDIASRFF